jgi:hypothetical protein
MSKKTYQLCFQPPDSVPRSRLFPSLSSQECAGHTGLCMLMFFEKQIHLAYDHCNWFLQKPKDKYKKLGCVWYHSVHRNSACSMSCINWPNFDWFLSYTKITWTQKTETCATKNEFFAFYFAKTHLNSKNCKLHHFVKHMVCIHKTET